MIEQQKLEREIEDAYRDFPPGSVLVATTARGIPTRSRAGVRFSEKGQTEVEVVDMTDEQIAQLRGLDQPTIERLHRGDRVDGLDGLDGRTASRLRSGGAFTNPMGAKAIATDDGLVVLKERERGAGGSRELDEKDRRIAELEATIAQMKDAQTRPKTSPQTGGPDRLAPKASEPFGGDDGKKG